MKKNADLLILNASQLLTMVPSAADASKNNEFTNLGIIKNGAVAVKDGLIVECGKTKELEKSIKALKTIDAGDKIVTPGLIDSHTHLVFSGSRHEEFAMRMKGASYQEILAMGGGIHSTVKRTRNAGLSDLIKTAEKRLETALRFGITTVEIKSGYGLDLETEIKMLEAVKNLAELQPAGLVPTFLGAHVVPHEYKKCREKYVDFLVNCALDKICELKLATACDVFLDDGAFSLKEAEKILGRALHLGMKIKMHAGQFSDRGGPQLAAEMGALSADHLEVVSSEGITKMAKTGVVANLLPGAAFCLRDNFPDGRRFIDKGVRVAISTDNNPGTSRTGNLPLMAQMAVTRMGLSCSEAWLGITQNAAYALGMENKIGSLDKGSKGDIAIFNVKDFRSFLYHFGINHCSMTIIDGNVHYGIS